MEEGRGKTQKAIQSRDKQQKASNAINYQHSLETNMNEHSDKSDP
jgi:hypothetical protein